MAHRLSCSAACGMLSNQGSNPPLLHRQVDSLSLGNQGSRLLTSLLEHFHVASIGLTMITLNSCMIFSVAAAAAAKPRPTLCDPIDSSPPGSPVPGVLQARTLGWVAMSFSNA